MSCGGYTPASPGRAMMRATRSRSTPACRRIPRKFLSGQDNVCVFQTPKASADTESLLFFVRPVTSRLSSGVSRYCGTARDVMPSPADVGLAAWYSARRNGRHTEHVLRRSSEAARWPRSRLRAGSHPTESCPDPIMRRPAHTQGSDLSIAAPTSHTTVRARWGRYSS